MIKFIQQHHKKSSSKFDDVLICEDIGAKKSLKFETKKENVNTSINSETHNEDDDIICID